MHQRGTEAPKINSSGPPEFAAYPNRGTVVISKRTMMIVVIFVLGLWIWLIASFGPSPAVLSIRDNDMATMKMQAPSFPHLPPLEIIKITKLK